MRPFLSGFGLASSERIPVMQQSKVLYNTAFLLRPVTPVQTKEELETLFDEVRKSLWPVLVCVPPQYAFKDLAGADFLEFLRQKEWNVRFHSENSLGFDVQSLHEQIGGDILHAMRRTRGIAYPGLQGCSDRTEVIDIGLQTDWKGRCLRFSYNSEMRYMPFAGFGEAPKEFFRMPEAVSAVLGIEGLSCDFLVQDKEQRSDGAPSYGLKGKPAFVQNEKEAMALASAIQDKDRPVCLVLYFGRTGKIQKEATLIARHGALKAHVYILDGRAEVLEPIRKALPGWDIDRNVRERSCRILFPFGEYASLDDANPRFRMAWPRGMASKVRLTRIFDGLLRYYTQRDRHGLLDLWEMQRLLAGIEVQNEKDFAAEAGSVADEAEKRMKQMAIEADDLQRELRDSRKKQEDLQFALELTKEDNKLLAESNESLRNYCERQNAELAKAKGKHKPLPEIPPPPPVFQDLVEILQYARKHLENLEILDQAFIHARDLGNRNPAEGYQMLKAMNDILCPLCREGGASIACDFQMKSGFECSFSEGGQTKDSHDIERERTIKFRGKTYVFWPHVRSRSHGEEQLIRAYFCYDKEAKKLLIGFFGKHLRTAGTDRM